VPCCDTHVGRRSVSFMRASCNCCRYSESKTHIDFAAFRVWYANREHSLGAASFDRALEARRQTLVAGSKGAARTKAGGPTGRSQMHGGGGGGGGGLGSSAATLEQRAASEARNIVSILRSGTRR
jgi:hypothetical protein